MLKKIKSACMQRRVLEALLRPLLGGSHFTPSSAPPLVLATVTDFLNVRLSKYQKKRQLACTLGRLHESTASPRTLKIRKEKRKRKKSNKEKVK